MSEIVENGKERYLEANGRELEAQRERLEAAVLARYGEELARAGFWRRLVLRVRMRREMRAACSSGESLYWTELKEK